jgi:hypothetical protein
MVQTTKFSNHLTKRKILLLQINSFVVILSLIFTLVVAVKRAEANTFPPYAHEWYITNPDTNANGYMFSLGEYDGTYDNSVCTNNQTTLALLNFGQVAYQSGGGYGGYGTYDFAFGYPFVSDSTILVAAERYIQGYSNTTGTCPHLKVVLGVNNYNQCPYGGACSPATAGAQWGTLVNDLHKWVVSQNYQSYISVIAGSDMEQPSGGQSWDCYSKTQSFVDGFGGNDPSGAVFLDYGTAWLQNDCWNASQVYYVAYGAPKDYPLPEIYFQSALNSWTGLG